MTRRLLLVPLLAAALAACSAAASDTDGEVYVAGPMSPMADKRPGAVPVVVDTDLAPTSPRWRCWCVPRVYGSWPSRSR